MRRICYRLIAEQAQSLRPTADGGAAGRGSPRAADIEAAHASGGQPTAGGEAAANSGQPVRGQAPTPVGSGLISHLLAAKYDLIGRQLTDMEVRLCCAGGPPGLSLSRFDHSPQTLFHGLLGCLATPRSALSTQDTQSDDANHAHAATCSMLHEL